MTEKEIKELIESKVNNTQISPGGIADVAHEIYTRTQKDSVFIGANGMFNGFTFDELAIKMGYIKNPNEEILK